MNWRKLSKNARFHEAVGLALLGLGLLSTLALLSFDPGDPSFAHASTGGEVRNWIGPGGAYLAGLLLEALGLTAWLLPPVLVAAGWDRLRHRRLVWPFPQGAGFLLLLLSTASLLALLFPRVRWPYPAWNAGGLVGERLATWVIHPLFARVGGVLVCLILIALGILLVTRVSLASASGSAETVARQAGGAGKRLGRLWGARFLALAGSALAWVWRALLTSLRRGREALASRRERRLEERGSAPLVSPPRPEPGPPETVRPVPPDEPAPPVERAQASAPASDRRPSQGSLPLPPVAPGDYRPPRTNLLKGAPEESPVDERDLLARAKLIGEKAHEFAVEGEVLEIHPGPVVTTFEFKPDAGIKLSRITSLADDLALALEAESIRIDRIAGRSTVGIEVPNRVRETIHLREIVESEKFQRSPSRLTLGLGKTQEGDVFVASLDKMPHLLVAGSTGAGKSVGLNSMILSILYKASPEEVRLILIDPKMLELGIYHDVPHLLIPVVTDTRKAANALRWAVKEMERRYRILAACAVRHVDQYNALLQREPERVARALALPEGEGESPEPERLPYLVVVIDELADLMMTTSNEVEDAIGRLAQMARAVGIHLILATQRPSVDVLTGVIKANFPARIAYRVSSRIDSRTIIDDGGAERLLGLGDMLYRPPGSARLLRLHGAFVTEAENLAVVEYLKRQSRPRYDESVTADPEEEQEGSAVGGGEQDPVFWDAVRTVLSTGQASVSFLQRRMRLGYARAARIVDAMELEGIVGPADGSKPREILVGADFIERLDEMKREASGS